LVSGNTYKVTSAITHIGDISIKSSNKTPAIIASATDFRPFVFTGGTLKLTTTATAEMECGDATVTLANVTGLVVGDLLHFTSDVLWYWDSGSVAYKGELHTIESITGNDVTLTTPVCDNYDITDPNSEVVTVTAYNKATIHIDNITIENVDDADSGCLGMALFQDGVITNLTLKNSNTSALSANYNYNTVFDKLHIDGSWSTTSTGYGLQSSSGAYTKVVNSTFTGCRRGVDFSGGTPERFSIVSDCIAMNTDIASSGVSGFGTHGGAEHITFSNNIIHGCRVGIYTRGGNMFITGNTFNMVGGQQAILLSTGNNAYIANNTVSSVTNRVALTTGVQYMSVDYFVTADTNDIKWTVQGNSCYVNNNNSANDVYFLKCPGANFSDSTILNNKYTVENGTKNYFSSDATIDTDTTNIDWWSYDDPSRLVVWAGGGGTIDPNTVVVDITAKLEGDYASYVGEVNFDIVGNTAAIRLNNFAEPSVSAPFFVSQDESYNLITLKIIGTELYISSDATGYDTVWAVGTGYVVPININYKR